MLVPFPAHGAPLTIGEFGQLALRCAPDVAPATLASIARTESHFQPLTISDNNTATTGIPATRDIAVQIASKLIEAGHSVDLGVMQINSVNFLKLGLTPESAFDPCRSIAAAATILSGDYAGGETHEEQQSALRGALSKYNTGDAQRGFENGYVHKVELAARQIVPALDVPAPDRPPLSQGAPSVAIDGASRPPLTPADPNAPPGWDVWASFDYDAMHLGKSGLPENPSFRSDPAVLADAGQGPAVSATDPGPSHER